MSGLLQSPNSKLMRLPLIRCLDSLPDLPTPYYFSLIFTTLEVMLPL